MIYHYTSISSLVQILENKNIKFNNLTRCDDLDEAETADLGRIGRYVFVSSWTRESQESIPMWSQYSGNMSGVRIGMREYPFKRRRYNNIGDKGTFDTYLDFEKYYNENKMTFAANQPQLFDVEYTEDDIKIHPNVLIEGREGDLDRIIHGQPSEVTLSFDSVGKYKRTCWAFQRECRYKIFGSPMGLRDMDGINQETFVARQSETYRRMTDESYIPEYQALFVDLDDEAIRKMEIVFGPRMDESQKILLRSYLDIKGLSNNYKDSTLLIQ